jgi:hypothetical protein
MRWPIKNAPDTRPLTGAIRYRIKFAWTPIQTTSASGPSVSWSEETIWLEKVVEVQKYHRVVAVGRGWPNGGWAHDRWYPLNEFTLSLYEHNNQ